MAGQIVEGPCTGKQQRGIETDRNESKAPSGLRHCCATEDGGERDCAAGGVQATGKTHDDDRQTTRDRGGQQRRRNQQGAGDPDQCRQDVAADNRPWLCQRAGRDGEEQHGAGAHRPDQYRQRRLRSHP